MKKYFMLDISEPVDIIFRNEDLGTANRGEVIISAIYRTQDKIPKPDI
jgi:hypothetical protein